MTDEEVSSAGLLRKREVAAFLKVSTRTVDRLVARGILPRPVRLSRGTIRFRTREVEARLSRKG